jgi:D-alanyl-D-alanine carboxypeptidase
MRAVLHAMPRGMSEQTFLTAKIDAEGGPQSVTDQACVPWWSFTKTVLATTALKLAAQGHCRLGERLGGRPYTLRQLLQHRAGVPNYGNFASYHEAVRRGDKPWEIGELLERVAADRLDFEPGHGWCYSNAGYLFVRQFIENVTHRDIGSALRHLIFDALGLRSVRLAATAQDLADTAWGNDAGYDPGCVYHGLLIGSPGDAARFLHSLMSGDLLPPELLTEMTTPHSLSMKPLPGRPWETCGYGLGLMIGRMASVGMAIGHSGAGPGSVSAVYHFPDRPAACTAGAFARGEFEGATEHEATRLARPL